MKFKDKILIIIGSIIMALIFLVGVSSMAENYTKVKHEATKIKTVKETTTEKITYKLIIEENNLKRIEIE